MTLQKCCICIVNLAANYCSFSGTHPQIGYDCPQKIAVPVSYKFIITVWWLYHSEVQFPGPIPESIYGVYGSYFTMSVKGMVKQLLNFSSICSLNL